MFRIKNYLFGVTLLFMIFVGCIDSPTEVNDDNTTLQEENHYEFPAASKICKELGGGANVGNALDAPNEGDWGVILQKEYFQWIADSGFKNVRIPVRWSTHAQETAPYTIDESFMQRVQWAVDEALGNDLHVIINMHHYEEIMADPTQQEQRFLSMWSQIARHFRLYSPKLLFEILNEPKDALDASLWNDLLCKAIDTIRVSNPKRSLIVGTASWGGVEGLKSLSLPNDTNLIVTVHYYQPHAFTHQGAAFEEGSDANLGTTWRATPPQRAQVDHDLHMVQQWAREHNRPIYMGEFGTYFKADTVSRAMYTEYLVRQFEELGFSWAVWNFSSDFGMYVDSTESWHGYLTNALLHPGNNAMLDSALAESSSVDLSTYVLVDDFDNKPGPVTMSETGAKWALDQGIPFDSSQAFWYLYHADSCRAWAPEGERLLQYWEEDSSNYPNFHKAVGEWGASGKGIHLTGHLYGKGYPYLGIGVAFTSWETGWYNMEKLTALQFKAKGTGELWVQLISDTISNGYHPDSSWGHFGTYIDLSDQWQDYIIPIENLIPKPYSPQQYDKLTWEDINEKISSIEFQNGKYGARSDDTLDIWLDDIRLIGLEESDLGL